MVAANTRFPDNTGTIVILSDSFFAGDTGPAIEIICLSTSGGLIDLTDAVIEGIVRRWNPRTKNAIGAIVTSGPATPRDQSDPNLIGRAVFDWLQAGPVDALPTEPGTYLFTLTITFPDGHAQGTQRVLFTVLPSSRVPDSF